MEYLTTYGWAILIVLVVGMVLWQSGVFDETSAVKFTGWDEIRPLAPGILYSAGDDHLEASLLNAGGTDIEVLNVSVEETIVNSFCSNVQANGADMPGHLSVGAGSVFKVRASCPGKEEGDGFVVKIRVTYNAVMHEITTSHTTEGYIEGTVED